jgi:hypothetical protein
MRAGLECLVIPVTLVFIYQALYVNLRLIKFKICLKTGCPTNFISVFLSMLLVFVGNYKLTTWG